MAHQLSLLTKRFSCPALVYCRAQKLGALYVEAVQRHLEAKKRHSVHSEGWAKATAYAFDVLRLEECDEVAKPEWWNDEGLKALSARVLCAAPNNVGANLMRATVLSGNFGASEVGLRSAAEVKKAAKYFDRSAALCDAPAAKAEITAAADWYRNYADAM